MLLKLKEVIQWTRMTAFELFLQLLSILVFSVLVAMKIERHLNASWPTIFTPLFICDGLNAYLCLIVFVRQYREYDLKQVILMEKDVIKCLLEECFHSCGVYFSVIIYRHASLRVASSLVVIAMIFTFKLLLCQKLVTESLNCSEVFAPLFVLSQILMIRACRMH